MDNYPPGVTGNEPQITGIWPCSFCEGEAGWKDEDGSVATCPHCRGTGIEPEEFELSYVEDMAETTEHGGHRLNPAPYENLLHYIEGVEWKPSREEDRRFQAAGEKIREALKP